MFGMLMIFDGDGLNGTTQLFTCPVMLLSLLYSTLILMVRNKLTDVLSKLILPRYSKLLEWYRNVEDKLTFEEYEDPNQQFTI